MEEFDVLFIASLPAEKLKRAKYSARQIFEALIFNKSLPNEKMTALFARKDVKGKVAFDILKKTAELSGYRETKEFKLISDLYIKKFIEQRNRKNSLIYAVLTCQLWFHDIGSDDSLKIKEADKRKEVLKPLLLAFFNRWTKYRRNTNLLVQDLNGIFGIYYNELFCFPGDSQPPFKFSYDNFVYDEVRSYVFPLLGETLRFLSDEGKACLSPKSVLPLVKNELIGDNHYVSYLKKISKKFTLEDLKMFDRRSLENFLISQKDDLIYQRFRKICQEEKAVEIFRFFNLKAEFAGINLLENREYSSLSLKEKGEFFRSYIDQYYHNKILKFWINDTAWNSEENNLGYLVETLLDNESLFDMDEDFYTMKALLLKKAYPNYLLYKEDYNHYKTQQILDADFARMLINILPPDNKKRAIELILLALPEEIEYLSDYSALVNYIISHDYEIEDLKAVLSLVKERSPLYSFEKSHPLTRKLSEALTSKMALIADKKIRLSESLKALFEFYFILDFSFHYFSEAVIKSLKAFDNLESLIEAVNSINVLKSINCKEEYTQSIREIENVAAKLCRNRADFIKFSQSRYFENDNALAWRWFLYHNPIKDFSKIKDDLQKFKEILRDDHQRYVPDLRKNLAKLWKSKPFEDTPADIFFSLNFAQPNEHPNWKKLPLAKRIDFIISGCLNNGDFHELSESLKDGFSESWNKEKWTMSRYLKKISPIRSERFVKCFTSLGMDRI